VTGRRAPPHKNARNANRDALNLRFAIAARSAILATFRMAKGNNQKPTNDSGLNFEAQLWAAAEQAVPAAHLIMTGYNGVRPEGLCLGLIFLKYISDAFAEKRDFSLSASNGDLSRLGGGERNSAKPKARFGPSERARASHWAGVRCRLRASLVNNANYAWIQHFIHHLSPVGLAGFVLFKLVSAQEKEYRL